jgi:hypothetical protein
MNGPDLPPGVEAELDQLYAETSDKFSQLVGVLTGLTVEYGIYGAMAIMGKSLEIAPNATLISMVLTGMQREMNRPAEIAAALTAVDAAQAEVEGNWSRSAEEQELTALRQLADVLRKKDPSA